MKYLVLSILVLILFVLPIYYIPNTIDLAFAAESSPSADIRVKLEELKKEIASKAAKLKQVVDQKLKDKAYIGAIKQKSDNSITLSTASNPKMVSINQDTVFESNVKGKTKYSQKILAEGDYIAALGDTDEVGVLTAKKIVLLTEPPAQKTFLWGQVISISDQLITLKNSDAKPVATTASNISGVKLNSFVILTGNKDKNDIFRASFVYVIPEGGVIKPKKVATPSATILPNGQRAATKSAAPKPASR